MPITSTPYTAVYGPLSIPGATCALWLDGVDPLGNGSVPANGSTLTTVVDKSTAKRNLIVGSGTTTYTTNSIKLNNSYMYVTSAIDLTSLTYFIVAKTNSLVDNTTVFIGRPNTDPDYQSLDGFAFYMDSLTGAVRFYGNRLSTPQPAPIAVTTSIPNVYTSQSYGTTVSTWINGLAKTGTTLTSTRTSTAKGFAIGAEWDGSAYGNIVSDASIYEIIVFNAALTTPQQQAIEGYLAQKWGLTSQLSPGHPGLTQIFYNSKVYQSRVPLSPQPIYQNFNPKNLKGCQLWLDAADIATLQLSGSSVIQWNDKSGNGRNCVNSTVSNYPSYSSTGFNGFPTLAWTSSVQMYVPMPAGTFPTSVTMFVVFQSTAPSGINNGLISRANLGNSQPAPFDMVTMYSLNFTYRLIGDGNGNFNFTSEPDLRFFTSTPSIYTMIVNNTPSWTEYMNGTNQNIVANLSGAIYSDTATQIQMNSRNAFTGKMSEVLMFSSVLTDTQRQQVEGYLAWKWGLQNSLVNHPYTNVPPGLSWESSLTRGITFISLVVAISFLFTNPLGGTSQLGYILQYNASGVFQWAASIGNASSVFMRSVFTDSNRNVLVAGYYQTVALNVYSAGNTSTVVTTLPLTGSNNGFIIQYNASGVVQWAAKIGNAGTAPAASVSTDSNRNVLVAGIYTAAMNVYSAGDTSTVVTTLPFTGTQNGFILQYNASGAVQWAAKIGNAGVVFVNGVSTDSNRNVLVAGYYYTAAMNVYSAGDTSTVVTTLPLTGTQNGFIIQYNASGAVQWAAKIGNAGVPFVNGVSTDSNRNVLVVGNYSGALNVYNAGDTSTVVSTLPFSGINGFIIQYNASGAVQWAANIGNDGTVQTLGVSTDSNRNVLVAGYYNAALNVYSAGDTSTVVTTLPFTGTQNGFILQYNASGAVQWAAKIGNAGTVQALGVSTDSNRNVLVAGYYDTALNVYSAGDTSTVVTTLPFSGTQNGFIIQYNASGVVQWAAVNGNAGTITTYGVSTDSNRNVLVAGQYNSTQLAIYNQGSASVSYSLTNTSPSQTGFLVKYNASGVVQWAANIGNAATITLRSVSTDSNRNVLVGGYYNAALNLYSAGNISTIIITLPFTGTNNGFIIQYNASGAVQWAANIGNAGQVIVSGVSTDSNRNVLVAGYYNTALNVYSAGNISTIITTLPFTGTNNGFIIQYNASGAVQWAANIGNAGSVNVNGVSTDSNRNVLVVGYYTAALNVYSAGDTSTVVTTLPVTGSYNGFIIQYNASGAVQWAAKIGNAGAVFVSGVSTDSNRNVLVAGYYNTALNVYSAGNTSTIITTLPFTGTNNGFIIQYNASGAVQWAANIGNAGTVFVRSVSTDSNRNVLVAGYYTATMNVYSAGDTSTVVTTLPFTGTYNGFIILYNASGAVQWAANIGNAGIVQAFGVSTDSNRNVLVAGYYTAALNVYSAGDTATIVTTLPLTGTRNGFILQYTASGAVQWAKAVSGTGTTVQFYGSATDTANNVYAAANSNSLTTTF